jgi:hypothetical protein
METKVRYRKLERGSIDWSDLFEAWRDERKDRFQGTGDNHLVIAHPPHLVKSIDGEGTLDDVKKLFRQGVLGRQDLVDVGRGWETLCECVEFDDVLG